MRSAGDGSPSAAGPTAGPTRAPVDSAEASADPATTFRADVAALLDARDTVHPDGWHGMERADWVAAADAASARAGSMSPDERLVELVRLAAMPSWNGRDGHSGIFPFIPGSGTHVYPVRWWQFSDGLVITAARAPYDALVGARVEAINGRPAAEVLGAVEPLAPRDNPSNLLVYGPLYLRVSELLAGLGVIERSGPTPFTVVGRDGERQDVTIEPVTAEVDAGWNSGLPHRLPPNGSAWLADQETNLWWSYLDDSRTLFVQFNAVRRVDPGLLEEIRERAGAEDVDRVVVDVRHNGGGDNTTLGPLEALLSDPAIDRPGRLFVLMGRVTFSAAANFVTDLERETGAIFAGEPLGGSPHLYGDVRRIDLPGGQALFMATRFWQRSTRDDTRITIQPAISVPFSSAEYFDGLDPVLDAVIAASSESG